MPFNSHINNIAKVLELSEQAFCHLDISTVPTEECKCLFRFTYTEIQSMCVLFEMGDKVYIERGSSTVLSVPTTEVLVILLCKMSFPCQLLDLSLLFGRNSTDISRISNHVVRLLHLKFGIAIIFDYRQFRPENLVKFSNAIRALGVPVEHCVRFLNGTFKETAKLTKEQKTKVHGFNYQAVVTPDVITSFFYGPVAGRRHYMTVFYESGIEMHMCKVFDFRSIGGPCYHLYADRGYTSSEFVMRPFAEIEKEFGHVGNLFAYVNYAQTQRILQGNVSSYYIVATLFKNLHVCYNHGNQTSMRFKVSSPTPMEYIAGLLNH
ncbi:hypothetical protein PHYBLDRAFT_140912 [Phycomyces blakesleeanus NRRL 1555(-)]|uniref:DDE Tnp4 domain-containing protein n=1 Tax=Phycomyces blakesleeanus (strain ATCC 8743b / DSM 1359 / FGSC 10004 / NBRC 33097 / NRRL 1555) TaxID=763407 RepID=A0A163B8X6_PHYB8|nr:hypothetical protein PHYBLDRAFT_140912 [Phycomyces blakesleeanus NRRL 1555(-)]OAD78861.1 hypothetical protein PHYBLDRAFT_140912 [Phycomyces blakesleeanus NRRL 1555(-)]|eukprot:XP_018296901.1 hypothetical protein PHYBLDRAFT_140912 [Phycomyces blakesleeanus NRRL 1555(-)]